MSTDIRCVVDVGAVRSPLAIRHAIEHIVNIEVRNLVEQYLTVTGVLIGRTIPPGWFLWLDASEPGTQASRFSARCADPPPAGARDDGYQPWNYYVMAQIVERTGSRWLATGVAFVHDSQLTP